MTVDNSQLDTLSRELQALWSSHRHDLIVDISTKILAIDPNNRNALVALANSLYQRARISESDDDFLAMKSCIETALTQYPSDDYFYYLLYHYYLWYGGEQYVQARDCLITALKISPENAEYYRQLGEIYLINREQDKATNYLQEAVRLSPNTAEYRSRLALALLRQHKITESVQMAHEALTQNPNDMRVLDTVGMIYILKGDLEKAEVLFRDAIKRDPTYNYFHQHMDWIKREKRDYESRKQKGQTYTPLYIRQKGTKRFFDEDSMG